MRIRLMLSGAVILLLAGSAMADPKVSREFRVEALAGSVDRVIVEAGVSELEIRNGQAGSIVAHGVVKREYESSEDIKEARAILDQSEIQIEIDGSRAIIRRKLGPDADGWRVRNQTQFTIIVEIPRLTSKSGREWAKSPWMEASAILTWISASARSKSGPRKRMSVKFPPGPGSARTAPTLGIASSPGKACCRERLNSSTTVEPRGFTSRSAWARSISN